MIENWKPVVGQDGYEVSDIGRVRSVDRTISFERHGSIVYRKLRGRMRKLQRDDEDCHLFVMLGDQKMYVHRMVLEAFAGPCPEGHECRHADDVKHHNYLQNLSWGTRSQNVKDAYDNGRRIPICGPEIALKAWKTKRLRAAERA